MGGRAIYAHAYDRIPTRSRGELVVRGCPIHGNEGGVWVYEQGRGSIENCDIIANTQGGICNSRAGDATVQGCRIHDA
ncbi:right-handed parallel beta-helix repeat-containing protein, partial [Streptomyces sp. GbtcB7]|uniref:right-handed parallel beta-helix repeat-containing protein n=1 Tax=Streptomyces sp. GbtcB7 TaxID=2824752 RepID=UPI0034D5F0D8